MSSPAAYLWSGPLVLFLWALLATSALPSYRRPTERSEAARDEVLRTLRLAAPSERDDLTRLHVPRVPPGRYGIDVVPSPPDADPETMLTLFVGRDPWPLAVWPLRSPDRAPVITLVAPVHSLRVSTSRRVGAATQVLLRPLGRPDVPAVVEPVVAEHVVRYGDLFVYLIEPARYVETGRFCLRGEQRANAIITREDGTTSPVMLTFESPAAPVAVTVTRGDWRNTGQVTGFARSIDGGASFTDKGALPPQAGNADLGDAALARIGSLGRILLATRMSSGAGIHVFRSFDDGASFFSPAVNAMPGFGGGDVLSKPSMAVDNFPGALSGSVYVAARNDAGFFTGSRPTGIYLTRSADAGNSFSPSGGVLVSATGEGASVVVGLDRSVYVFYRSPTGPSIRMRKSTDFLASLGPEVTVAALTSTAPNGDLGLIGGFASNSFPRAAVNPLNGRLYVVYNDPSTSSPGGDRGNIRFRWSGDGGTTWHGGNPINADGTARDQFFPTIAVAPDGRRVFVGWYDRRNSPANLLIEYWGVIGSVDLDGPLWGPNFRISSAIFPPVRDQDPAVNATYMGGYDGAAADDDWFYVAWGDNRLSNAFHANQPDVRFAKIPVRHPAFNKVVPTDGATNQPPSVRLLWSSSAGATSYELCVDTSNNNVCDTSWTPLAVTNGTTVTNLAPLTTYYWQVRSTGPTGITEANEGLWSRFTTQFYRLAQLLQPTNFERLPGQTVPFAWDAGVNVVQYSLFIGSSPGAGDIYMQNESGLFRFVTNDMPVDGRTIYVRLYSRVADSWLYLDYIVLAATGPSSSLDFGIEPMRGDYDGDGIADLATWWGRAGVWQIRTSSTSYLQTLLLPWGREELGDRPVMGDFDGDGKADPTIWRSGPGIWFVLLSSQNHVRSNQWSWGRADLGDVPVPADYDGDGKTDPAVWRRGTGYWYALKSSTNYSQYLAYSWGREDLTDRPVVGDYDGDNKADPAVWRGATGQWLVLKSSTNYTNYINVSWGSEDQTDQPVPADYDGDGRTDLAVWRRATGFWYILTSSTNYAGQAAVQLGIASIGDRPAQGRFILGDAKVDPTVWRGSTGLWHSAKSPVP